MLIIILLQIVKFHGSIIKFSDCLINCDFNYMFLFHSGVTLLIMRNLDTLKRTEVLALNWISSFLLIFRRSLRKVLDKLLAIPFAFSFLFGYSLVSCSELLASIHSLK